MNEEIKVERTERQVIYRRLLVELQSDSTKVAVLFSKEDLDLLIKALYAYDTRSSRELREGFEKLRKEAFGV